MTIRKRLTLSFLIILSLFGLNLAIYFWTNQKRSAMLQEVQNAVSRQELVTSISNNLDDKVKQLALLNSVLIEAEAAAFTPDQVRQFKTDLKAITEKIDQLLDMTAPEDRQLVEKLAESFEKLSHSWGIYYEILGVDQSRAIMEMAIHAEPLSPLVVNYIQELRAHEKEQVAVAGRRLREIQRFTSQITLFIFAVSTLTAVLVAFLVSRYLTRRLDELKNGAGAIGAGNLECKINVRSEDELGQLAGAFNRMTGNLASAQSRLLQAKSELEKRHQEVEHQRRLSESLLHNILPEEVAGELQNKGSVDPKYFEDVTILFTDFVGFTLSTEKMAAEDLVFLLQDYFTAFDRIIECYGLEKLKTIGDAYMCAGGLPVRDPSHPVNAILAAFEMLQEVENRVEGPAHWAVRIGLHTGPVIAGVVGIKKFAFDVWGETVNYSSRMESSGAPNHINVSQATYLRVKDFFECEYRGKIGTKDKREVDMYFVRGILPALLDDSDQSPPPSFLRRYRIYFQKEPPAFPTSLLEHRNTQNTR